ncbi:MAG: four helix bundle protein [Clostridium sp.]|nr:four helix bundle protein [Clostridium sp.]
MVKIGSVKGYFFLDAWVLANIIQLATTDFCRRFLNKDNDPCGRMHDQMTQAARSVTANIAEGVSRHQTSAETEMKLCDVARASASELAGDYFFLLMSQQEHIWKKSENAHKFISEIKLDKPSYSDDWQSEAADHILRQKEKFSRAIDNQSLGIAANAILILCNREIRLIEKLLLSLLNQFKASGGFTENLTKERVSALKLNAQSPECPRCGGKMRLNTIKRGVRQGQQFWGCLDYPKCDGTLNYSGTK